MRTAASRREAEDHLVDCVIGLERLLAPDTSHLKSTFRFQLRGAALLPDRFGGPAERIKLLKELYGLRSKVVHGGAEQEKVDRFCIKAEEILREVVLWYLEHGAAIGDAQAVVKRIDEVMIAGGTRVIQPHS